MLTESDDYLKQSHDSQHFKIITVRPKLLIQEKTQLSQRPFPIQENVLESKKFQ